MHTPELQCLPISTVFQNLDVDLIIKVIFNVLLHSKILDAINVSKISIFVREKRIEEFMGGPLFTYVLSSYLRNKFEQFFFG